METIGIKVKGIRKRLMELNLKDRYDSKIETSDRQHKKILDPYWHRGFFHIPETFFFQASYARISSIRASSSVLKLKLFRASTASSIWLTLLAPIKAEVTRPPRNTHAKAI